MGFRKVKYRDRGVLTSKFVNEGVGSILESLAKSDLEEAKRKIQALAPEAKNDRERGSLHAATGIYSSLTKEKDGSLYSWDAARIERAAKSMTTSQMVDEFDLGYAETLLNYSRLTGAQHSAE